MDIRRVKRIFRDTEALQDVASSLLTPLRVSAPPSPSFQVDLHSAGVGSLVVGRIRGSAHVVTRDAAEIASTDREMLKVTLHRGGQAIARQSGRQARIRSGDLVVLDTRRPYQIAVTADYDVVVIGLPHSTLGLSADIVARRVATPVASDGGVRALIAAFLSGVADNVESLRCGEEVERLSGGPGLYLADALGCLLVAAFAETTPERVDTATGLTDRIMAFALANLCNPGLCTEAVARRHGISPRKLHYLFRRRGHTFAAWVRHQRLLRIRRDLRNAGLAGRTTAAIATGWGMPDPTHLARALKREFGQTAAEIRRTAPAVTFSPHDHDGDG